MNLTCYVMDGYTVNIRPAPFEREWMDNTKDRFAYRCLPLNIANAHGWEILCDHTITAIWNGSSARDAITIIDEDGNYPGGVAASHFGYGVLTFHIPALFRTEPGFDLMAQGPINAPKDGITALSGMIETDWSPYSFTMNWKMTRPHHPVRFKGGEPFCLIYPVRRADLESVEPKLTVLSANKELHKQNTQWQANRGSFIADLDTPGSDAQAQKWQRAYYRGMLPYADTPVAPHRTRLRLKPFEKA